MTILLISDKLKAGEALWKTITRAGFLAKRVEKKGITSMGSARSAEPLVNCVEAKLKVIAVLQSIFAALKKLVTQKTTSEISEAPFTPSWPTQVNQPLRPEDEEKLSQLYPPFAQVVRQFLMEARHQGMLVGIFEGLRSFERQKELYAKGRDANGRVVDRKQVATNAPPGFSYHNYGCAVDIVFSGAPAGSPGWQWSWDGSFPWKRLASIGQQEFGLEAAFFWSLFPEAPHFQITYGFKEHQLLAVYNEDGLTAVWATLNKAQSPG